MEKKKRNVIIAAIVAACLIVGGGAGWWFGYEAPHRDAEVAWQSAVDKVNAENAKLDKALDKADRLVKSKAGTLDPQTKKDARQVVKDAKKERRAVGEKPKGTDELKMRAKELAEPLDYSAAIKRLEDAVTSVDNGIRQLKQVTDPSQDFIVSRLRTVPGVTGIESVTEGHDPNGFLNRQGGYTASIYFSYEGIDLAQFDGDNLVDKGTESGGNIEVYRTKDDAAKREAYHAAFDGTVLSSGSHTRVGTIVIRVSDQLPAAQQQAVQQQIVDAFTRLE